MRKFLLLLLNLLFMLTSSAQVITQNGVAYRYNGKKSRTPLGKVYIKVATSPNAVLSDSVSGRFSLHFNGMSMGAYVGKVIAQKRGMMIFNQQAVDEWNIRKEPLQLILCDAGEFEKQKETLIAIGQREAMKRYKKKIAEIESKYKAESAEWYHKYSEADEELQKIRKHLAEYADLFARIDESEIDSVAQQAISLFNEGRIEEAISKFEEGRFVEKLKKVNGKIFQGQILLSAIQANVEKTKRDKEILIKSINAQVEAYKLKGDYSKAGDLLKKLADELNTLEGYNEYASFCKTQNNLGESELYYNKMLAMLNSSTDSLLESTSSYSTIYHSLGELYMDIQDYKRSEEMFQKAMKFRIELVKKDSMTYLPKLAFTLNDLGLLYNKIKSSEMAENYYLEALSIKRSLYLKAPREHSIDLAKTLCNLGNLYIRDYKYEKSDSLLNEALSILQGFPNNSDEYKNILAITYNSLGLLYGDMKNHDKSKDFLLKSLEVRKEMAMQNPEAYNPGYAVSLTNTAIMYCQEGNLDLGEEMLLETKRIYEALVKQNPDAYETSLSRTYGNLGILYNKKGQYKDSKLMYFHNLNISKRKFKIDSIAYGGPYANMLANIGLLYAKMEQVDSQLIAFNESYRILKMLSDFNPRRYENDFVDVVVELGRINYSQESYADCAMYFTEAITILRRLHESNPNRYQRKLSSTLLLLSSANLFNRKFKESEEYAREGIDTDPEEELHYTNLAASLLLQGKLKEAEEIYLQHKNTLKDDFLDDLKHYSESGVIPSEYEKYVREIVEMLNE